jgi:hypothetical protein
MERWGWDWNIWSIWQKKKNVCSQDIQFEELWGHQDLCIVAFVFFKAHFLLKKSWSCPYHLTLEDLTVRLLHSNLVISNLMLGRVFLPLVQTKVKGRNAGAWNTAELKIIEKEAVREWGQIPTHLKKNGDLSPTLASLTIARLGSKLKKKIFFRKA